MVYDTSYKSKLNCFGDLDYHYWIKRCNISSWLARASKDKQFPFGLKLLQIENHGKGKLMSNNAMLLKKYFLNYFPDYHHIVFKKANIDWCQNIYERLMTFCYKIR